MSFFISTSWAATSDFDRNQIQQRLSPIGQVRVEDLTPSSNGKPQPAIDQPVAEKDPGKKIYEQYCSVCHRDGIAGAPKFRNAKDWDTRLAQKKIEGLTATAIKGLNAMPAKGTCQECTERDITAAINYMVPQ